MQKRCRRDYYLTTSLDWSKFNPSGTFIIKSLRHLYYVTFISTFIKRRIKQAFNAKQPYLAAQQPTAFLAFAGNPREGMPDGIPFVLSDYLTLVDWSGRIIREDKKGHIA